MKYITERVLNILREKEWVKFAIVQNKWKHTPFSRMWGFIILTLTLCIGLSFCIGYLRREEIMANWGEYRTDPFFIFAAPLFKPDDDKRSRIQFATDNFFEVIEGIIMKTFAVLLEPIFKIFKLFFSSLEQTTDGLFNVKSLLANMWDKWNKMTDPFMRRFNNSIHQLRVTFIKLYSSMEKSYAIAISSIYAGLSTIHTMLSFIDLIMTIIIIILCILVVMMILLFFVLAPFLPLILTVLGVISGTAFAGAVGGMAGTFCFMEGTRVHAKNGPIPIESIQIGDTLSTGANVLGIMKFHTLADDLYSLHGVLVSGTHILYEGDSPIHVEDHPSATKHIVHEPVPLYCLITSDRKIPIVSSQGVSIFADWEEIQSMPDLRKWNEDVFRTLNPESLPKCSDQIPTDTILSESVFSNTTYIVRNNGYTPIDKVSPGDWIQDSKGLPTKVLGIVAVDSSQVLRSIDLGNDSYMSCAAWIQTIDGIWSQPNYQLSHPNTKSGYWYNLFTESGSFQIVTNNGVQNVRDFTDLGPNTIHQSYNWVLQSLKNKNSMKERKKSH